ncbi:hypothetical protein D920_01912 [Enterococcus faecalis 13-SD-W-01]|nr:hypothetical protein D920_01912 [Enterococcus faecalis 13-SD-W-01]
MRRKTKEKNQSFDQYRHNLLDYHDYFLGHFTFFKKDIFGHF